MMDTGPPSPHKKKVSVNFSHAGFSLLDFLTSEDGADRLSRNDGNELPLYSTLYLRKVDISHDNLVIQGLVWPSMI